MIYILITINIISFLYFFVDNLYSSEIFTIKVFSILVIIMLEFISYLVYFFLFCIDIDKRNLKKTIKLNLIIIVMISIFLILEDFNKELLIAINILFLISISSLSFSFINQIKNKSLKITNQSEP